MNHQDLIQTASDVMGINNLKTAHMGGTIIDIEDNAGYTSKSGQMSALRKPDQVVSCPNDALLVYPSIEQAERENGGNDDIRVMGAMWINGFVPHSRGIPEPDNATRAASVIMAKFGVVTVDQLFKSRGDDVLSTFCTFFKWYGGSDEDRILPKDVADDSSIGKNVRRGMVCAKWAIKPIPVRYVVKIRGNQTSRDHLYMVGGSPELLTDNMSELANSIGSMYKQAKNLRDSSQKAGNIPNDVKYCDDLANKLRVWYEYDEDDYSDALKTHDITKARLLFKKLNRTCQGIIYIRNYFHYAKRHMGIKKVADFNLAVSKTPVEVDIDTLIDKYEDIYQYVRNICRIKPEIGAGQLEEA